MIDHAHWSCHQFEMPPILKNFHDIWNHSECEDFLQSCHQKIQKLEKKKIFQVVNKSDNAFLLFLMWVFDYKFDDNSFFLKHKFRIMIHDDLQFLIFRKIYMNTLTMQVFHTFAIIICSFNFETRYWDAVNVFLNNWLDSDEHVYTHMLENFKIRDKIWLLLQILYELFCFFFLWFKKLSSSLKNLDFILILDESCCFTNDWIIIFFYIDDIILIFCQCNIKKFEALKSYFFTKYEFCDQKKLAWFLNIQIICDKQAQKFYFIQDVYIDKIIQ